jgi:hypothetical protein
LEQETGKPEQPASRSSLYVHTLFSITNVDSEEDVEKVLKEIKDKLNKKLKDGPFNIKW